jgi:8-oxo-dGTP pyrophosphatase MutT (NUDIX family)
MIDAASIRTLVSSFRPDQVERSHRSIARFLEFLRSTDQPIARTNYQPGHVTASGIVLSPDRERVLLVYHHRLRRWLQPGGHVEPGDQNLAAAAGREVREETAVIVDPSVPPVLVGIDVHEIPDSRQEPAHLHFDAVFRFLALDGQEPASDALRAAWCPPDWLEEFGADEPLVRAARRARQLERGGRRRETSVGW